MSLNSILEEEGNNYSEDNPEPFSNDSYELFAACQRPCKVVLERLSEEEIQLHLSIVDDRWDRPVRAQKQIARNYLKDVPRVHFGLFAQYKRSRQKFINKRNLKNASAEIGDFGFSSSEEFQLPSDEDYVPEVSHKKKRKRLAYEEDHDWNPTSVDGWVSPRPKKTLRNLRVNTRRKRIESNSSGSSDEDFEKIYDTRTAFESVKAESAGDASFEMKSSPKKEPAEEAGFSAASLLDSDLLSQIMQEMEDFNRKKGSKSLKSLTEGGKKLEGEFSCISKSRQKPRVSRVIKITDDLTPTIRHVQQVVKNMVNTVCSFERQREQAMEETRKRTCKWCDVLFLPRSKDEELCKICKDVVKLSSTPKTSNKRVPKPKGVGPKPGAKSKIKSKILKNLPKYEQRRLMYGEKVSNNVKNCASQQGTVENILTMIAAEVHPEPPSPLNVTNPAKKRKLKNNSNLSAPKTKVIKTKKKKLDSINVEGLAPFKPMPKKITGEKKNHVDKNSKNSILRIDFPDAEASGTLGTSANLSSQTIVTKQPATNNVQYGTYLLPPIPTVVVANYAATDAKSGDYYLSSVYYQNEMTQAKNAPGRNESTASNIAAAKSNSLPSMPSMDQLSISFLDQLPNIPSPNFSQSGNMDTFPSAGYGVEAKMVDNKSLANQQQVPLSKTEYNPYSLEHDIGLLLNNPNLQIQPVELRNSNVTTESNIASLFSNSQLQIEPLFPSHDMPYESFEPDRQHEESDDGAPGVENENQSADMPSNEPKNLELAPGDKSADAPKPVKKPKETKQHLKDKKQESNKNLSEEPSEEDLSSEALFRKMSTELDAIGILGVVDLDKSPRFSLERIMETNKTQFEQLQGMKPMTKDVEAKLKQAEDNRTTLRLAKTLLNTFGSFSKLSNSCLMHAKILQIKKEKNLEQEETRSSCQFSQSQSTPAYIDIMGDQGVSLDHIANIETQISSIPAADLSQYGTVHHFPAPASIPRSESRETPSRGSGPLTPARPESAMSQAEEPALTPLQIKKERMEAPSSPSRSFATPPVVSHQPNANNQSNPPAYVSNQPQQQAIHIGNQPLQQATHVSNQPQQQTIHTSNQASMGIPTSEDTFHILKEMTQRLQNVGQSGSQLRNVTIAPSNQPLLRNVTIAPSNNQQMHSMMHFHGRPPGPPNVTVPSNNNNQSVSKVLLNFAARQQTSPSNNPNISNTNYIFKNGQMVNIQHQNSPNTPNLANANVMFKNTQMVNVQQVYLPSSQQRFQPNNPGMNQFNIVQQGQMVPSQGQQVLVNSAGQGGYSFQGQQMLGAQQQVPRVSNMNAHLQQNQGVQSSANQAFLMQNNRPSPLSSEDPMFCALCSKPATLRCKQCAKIAYCDTKCAKTYWHSRHKSECKQMVN